MKSVRLTTLGSIAFAALLSATVSAATAASEQDGAATTPDAIRFVHGADDAPPRSDSLTSLEARREKVRDSTAGEKPLPAGPRRRPFVAVLAAVPLVTYAAATGPRGSEILTPADRFATSQLIGVGYVVNPQFRFGVMGLFNEVLTGLPPAADAWQFGGIAPIAIGTFEHVIIGGGPIIGYRSNGTHQSDVGAVALLGASVPLRKGLALNIAAPVTALVVRRVTVSFGIAVGVAKVF